MEINFNKIIAYDTDDSLGMRVNNLLKGERLRVDLRERSTKESVGSRSTISSEQDASDKTEDLLKPMSVDEDVDPDEATKYSPGRVSASSSKASTFRELKEGEFKSEEPIELPIVDPAREREITSIQQQAAEDPELEGIEGMNLALSYTKNHRQKQQAMADKEQRVGSCTAQQQQNDSLMKVLSALGEGVDPEIMERIATRAFSEQQLKQCMPTRDDEEVPLNQSQLVDRSLDSLSNRVNLLLLETGSIGARLGRERSVGESSTSSRRSTQTSGSINYDKLQRELDDIQCGLAALQNGDLSIK